MKKRLKDIATIQPGFSFRGRIEPKETGRLSIVQIKDIGENGTLLVDELVRTDAPNVKLEYFVRPGDVLFTTRGLRRRAALVTRDMDNTVYVAQIFAVRGISQVIEPAFLAWYLNQVPAQEHFEMFSTGAFIQNIRKEVLEHLLVSVPPLETQRTIVEIHRLRQRESSLRSAIREKRNLLVEQTLLAAIEN
jgi:restriction endonuclease S subunit